MAVITVAMGLCEVVGSARLAEPIGQYCFCRRGPHEARASCTNQFLTVLFIFVRRGSINNDSITHLQD